MTNGNMPNQNNEASKAATYIVLGLIIVVAIIIFLAYWNNNQVIDEPIDEPVDNGVVDEEVTSEEIVNDILENPNVYAGQTVVLNGEVEELVGNQAFVFDTLGIVDDKILVIGQNPLGEMIINEDDDIIGAEEGDEVTITGTVRMFTFAEIEQEIEADLDQNLFIEFENLPVIIATSIINTD